MGKNKLPIIKIFHFGVDEYKISIRKDIIRSEAIDIMKQIVNIYEQKNKKCPTNIRIVKINKNKEV